MENHGYKDLANLYDIVTRNKNYINETEFLKELFKQNNVKTVLDVGCGTGTHMQLLENAGYKCDGIDLNQDMLNIAKTKVNGNLTMADMTNFELNKKYDAVICMFAAFNHLTELSYAKDAINCFNKHLNPEGIILLDLHNPQRNGNKQEIFGDIQREMEWKYNPITKFEESVVKFRINEQTIIDKLTLRIYSIDEIKELLKVTEFSKSMIYEGYGFKIAQNSSKNLEIFAKL